MPVTFRTELYLECDGEFCNNNLQLDNIDAGKIKHPTAKIFKKIARKDGWKINENDACWCPECKKRRAT